VYRTVVKTMKVVCAAITAYTRWHTQIYNLGAGIKKALSGQTCPSFFDRGKGI